MRNLKKILALVLALIMSLSLMATASATDFKDDANVGETYRVAVDVLSDLSVFGGDQNGNFNPQDPIRRSEVAAIIYRIATGDTGSEGHKSYTPYNQFADVVDGSWYAGYVTYCANAGYIKGRNDGNFHPNDNVTGYEVLAMILRAVGYDKNNEFVGSNWQTNTASIATQRGVLKNLTGTTLLSQPATREVVAELLFRSIMLQQVTWNANSLSYSDNGATLAKQNLNMEAVTGVVMGNERGNLEGTSVLAEGKTSLLVNGETSSRTLNVSTDLTVIGESRSAYIQGSKVLGGLLEDAGNDVKDNEGAETTVAKLRGGLNVTDAEHFINFADKNQDSSEWLIRYVVEKSSIAAGSAWENYLNGKLDGDNTLAVNTTQIASNVRQAYVNTEAKGGTAYEVTIKPETVINSYDKAIMKAIFYTADRNSSNPDQKPVEGYAYGEVYVGTSSLEDKSDIMSWNKFVETYLVTGQVKPITEVGNGNWLKIIDNNGDGKAEYVLHTIYTLDEVADSATRNGATTYFYNGIDSTAYTPIYLDGYTPAVGDIVLYAVIDGTYQIHKADTAKATFKAVNYKDRQATDVNGDVKEESDIINETRLPQTLTNVNENVEYDLYLDDYGYVRAYNNKTSYALVTEMYTTNKLNQGWVTGRALTAEVALAGENAIREYPVLNSSYYNNNNQNYNPFYTAEARYPIQNWNWVVNEAKWVQGEPNYLKPATHMLDMGQKQGNEFHFADSKFDGPSDNRTWTNVAEYIMGDNGINLYTAAKDNDNSQNPSTDYIQLAIRGTSAANPLYVINDVNYPKDTGDVNAQDNYVRAVDNTQFFAVDQYGSVRQWVGYRNTLKLDAEKNGIHAMYAVATNTNANRDSKPYWVANVIVIEVKEFTESFESISLIYSNNTKISGDVKYLQALDNAKGEIGIIPNNIDIWNGQFKDYGFYGLTNIKVYDEENKLYTADVTSIHSSYGTNHTTALKDCEDYKIFYGVVRSRLDENYYSDYITADVIDINGNVVKESVTLSLADFGGAYRIIPGANNYRNYYNEAVWMTLGGHASNRVNEGDRILWVEVPGNSTNKVGFIVDINDKYVPGSLHTWENAAFIETLRSKIALEQTTTPVDPVEAAKTAAVNALNAAAEAAKAGLDKDAPDYDAKVAAINAALEAALTKVNEAATVEDVETAKTEGLKAIEEAKGDVPASEFALTLTIGENVTKVTVTVTEEGKEPVSTDYTETPAEAIKVPAGAKVEFAAEYAEGYEALKSAAPIEKMEADQTAEFTAKKIGEVVYTLTVKTDEHVEKVIVTITNGEEVTTEEVTTREQNISVPENAAVSFEATYAEGYKAGSTVDNIDAMTGNDEVSFTSIVDASDKATFALNNEDPTATKWYWGPKYDDPNKVKTNIEIKAVEGYEVGAEIAIADFVNMPELPSQEDENGVAATDWDIVFAPADAAHYDYEKNVVVVDKIGEILVSVMCYNLEWTKEQGDSSSGGDEGDGDPWNPDFGGTTGPSSRARMASIDAARDRVKPDADGNVPFYVGYLDANKVLSKIVVNGVQIDTKLAEISSTTEKGNIWTFPVKFAGNYVYQFWTKDKDNAPEITVKVVDGTGAVVPAAEYEVTESHTSTTVNNKTTYNYTYNVVIKDTTKYGLPTNGSASYVDDQGKSDSNVAVSSYGRGANGGKQFTVKGVTKAGTVTITFQAADTVAVTLSDKVTLSIDKDKFLKGADRKDQTITLALTENYKDTHTLPISVKITVDGKEGLLEEGADYLYNNKTGVITFLSGKFDYGFTIAATADVKDGAAVGAKGVDPNFEVKPAKVAKVTFDELPVFQIVVAKGTAYPSSVKVEMKDASGTAGSIPTTEYTYDKATGQIKFSGTRVVKGDIQIDATVTPNNAVKELKVSVTNGKLVIDPASPVNSGAYQYMVINKTASPEAFANVQADMEAWLHSTDFELSTLTVPNGCYEFAATAPTLTKDNNGDYILVVEVDATTAPTKPAVKAVGYATISGITEEVVGPDKLTVSDKNLTASRDGDVITITPAKAGYLVPSVSDDIVVTVGGQPLHHERDDQDEWYFVAGENGASCQIVLKTDKTGDIFITMNAVTLLAKLDVTIAAADGAFTVKKGSTAVSSNVKYVLMNNKDCESDLAQMTTGMTEATFLEAVGLYATSGTATSTQAAELAANGSNKWALVYELNGNAADSKVIAAGFGENKHVAAAPRLSTTATDNQVLGANLTVGTAAGSLADVQLANKSTVADNGSGTLKLTATDSQIEVVYVPTYLGMTAIPSSWEELKAADGVKSATLTTGSATSDADFKAMFKCGNDDTVLKNGTLYVQVTKDGANGYHAIPIEFTNNSKVLPQSNLNLAKPESDEVWVFLTWGSTVSNTVEASFVELVGDEGAQNLTIGDANAMVYDRVKHTGGGLKIVVTVPVDTAAATSVALATATGFESAVLDTATDPNSGVTTITIAQSDTTSIGTGYLVLQLNLT